MEGDHSRRSFLARSLGAAGFATMAGRPVAAAHGDSNTLEIASDGGGMAAYEFEVNGDLRQADDDDHVTDNRAYGHLGPKRGTDTFAYSGDLTGMICCGPASVYRNGTRIRPAWFPHPEGELTSGDFAPRSGTNALRIESDGGGVAAYEFEVTGSLGQRDSDDHVTDNHAYGHLGPKRGTDEFEFTGEVTRFELAGPASAYLNGSAVTPGSSGGRESRVVRTGPTREVTAVPETPVLFEAAAPAFSRRHLRGEWYVDGRRRVGPDVFYGNMGTRGSVATTHSFDAGTHSVRVDVYPLDEYRETDADPIGSVEWTVRVGPDGNRPPTVRRVRPETDTISASEETMEFEVAARDPEGTLDRVVWWVSQCDVVVDVARVTGANDTATLSFSPESLCPIQAWAVDKDGSLGRSDGWNVERNQ